MKFVDFFSGVGGFTRGMELAGHECVGHCEFDKYAEASYRSMHTITEEQRKYLLTLPLRQRQKEILKDEYLNGEWYANDVCRVIADDIPRAECWCFGFPCQDISIAGHQHGFKGNRSSLFFRVTNLIEQLKEEDRPNTLFIENVKNLLSVNRGLDFARLLVELDKIGYDAEWQVINSKHHGVPQNRERVLIVGHLRGRGGREVFPIKGTSTKNSIKQIGKMETSNGRDNPNRSTRGGEIKVKEAVKKGYTEATKGDSINFSFPNSKLRRGRVGKQVAQTLDTNCNQAAVVGIAEDCKAWAIWSDKYQCYLAIRKLTPRECFRLQGWEDKYFERAEQLNSNSQLYKQAGNGVTVTVIKHIAERM